MLHLDTRCKGNVIYLNGHGILDIIKDYMEYNKIPEELFDVIKEKTIFLLDEFVFDKELYHSWLEKYYEWNKAAVSKFLMKEGAVH